MNNINIIVDRHFPYSTELLKSPGSTVRKIRPPKWLPAPLSRIYHAFDLYYKSFKVDIVLGNRRSALLLGLLNHIYKPKKSSLIGYEIIFNFKNNFKNKLVKLIWRVAVRKIDKLVVMSRSECKYLTEEFRTSLGKFSTISFFAEDAHYIGPEPEGYIFSAGRMERDFETLVRSLQNTSYPAIIVADKSQEEKLEKIKPPHVQILYNIHKEKYLQLLRNARLVVVPLHEGAASRGQVVILEAMKYGKPLVCTRVQGTVDYLEDGKEGIFVPPAQPDALRKVFDTYFEDFDALEKIGKQAFNTQQSKYTPEIFYKSYKELIRKEYLAKNKMFKVEVNTEKEQIHQQK